MAIPKEPRALMIQLMYLVLTAMLALNITREVLNAFVSINDSITRTNTTIGEKNNQLYAAFDAKQQDDKGDRVRPWNEKAKVVKSKTAEIYDYLESLKDSVLTRAGGTMIDERTGKTVPVKMEDIDAATLFFNGKDNTGGEGNVLKEKLRVYIDDVLAGLDDQAERDAIKAKIPINLNDYEPSEDNPKGDWSFGNFNNIPVVAASAILSKFQSDVRNAEGMVVETMYRHIDDNVLKFDELQPIAVANTSYALVGDEITATVTLAAYNKNVNPTVTSSVGGAKVENGVGTIKFKASGNPGPKTINGNVSLAINGENKSFPWKLDYYIGTTGASLGLDKMNVFYIGVPNPVTLSASGYDIEKVSLEFSDATITKNKTGKNTYDITAVTPTPKNAGVTYTIFGTNSAGAKDKIHSGTILVKRLPNPMVLFNGKPGGTFEAHTIRAQYGPYATLGEDFLFQGVKCEVVSYEVVLVPKEGWAETKSNKGKTLNGEARSLVDRVRPGDMILFKDIRVSLPDKTTRNLGSLTVMAS